MAKNSHHVVPNSKGGWSVKKSGSIRASKTFTTHLDAVEYGKKISIDSKSDLIIHGKDGTIQKKDSFGKRTIKRNIKKS